MPPTDEEESNSLTAKTEEKDQSSELCKQRLPIMAPTDEEESNSLKAKMTKKGRKSVTTVIAQK